MTSLSDWLKAIQLKPRFLFGLWLLGSLILFLPIEILDPLGISSSRATLQPWLGFGTLAAFAFWIVQLIPIAQSARALRRQREEMIRSLDSLSPEEWVLLAYCLEQNQQTVALSVADIHGGTLAARGLLIRQGGTGNITAWPHTIPGFIWEHLRANKAVFLASHPFGSTDEAEARIMGLHHHIMRHRF